jgi:hypothetical protein
MPSSTNHVHPVIAQPLSDDRTGFGIITHILGFRRQCNQISFWCDICQLRTACKKGNQCVWPSQNMDSYVHTAFIQLRTCKPIKFDISRMRIFWLKLMTDSDSGGQIKLKYTLYIKFPRGFECAKFLGKIFATICHIGQQPMPNSVSVTVLTGPDWTKSCLGLQM